MLGVTLCVRAEQAKVYAILYDFGRMTAAEIIQFAGYSHFL